MLTRCTLHPPGTGQMPTTIEPFDIRLLIGVFENPAYFFYAPRHGIRRSNSDQQRD